MRCRAVPCRAAPCRAAPCRARPYGAVLCGGVRCCAVLCRAVPCCAVLFRTCQVSFDEVSSSRTKVHHTRFVRTTMLNLIKRSQLSSAVAQHRAAQRRVVPCDSVHCPAVRRRAVLLPRCAIFRTHSTRYHAKYQVPSTGMYVCTRLFAFFSDCPSSRSSSSRYFSQNTPVLPIRM